MYCGVTVPVKVTDENERSPENAPDMISQKPKYPCESDNTASLPVKLGGVPSNPLNVTETGPTGLLPPRFDSHKRNPPNRADCPAGTGQIERHIRRRDHSRPIALRHGSDGPVVSAEIRPLQSAVAARDDGKVRPHLELIELDQRRLRALDS